MTREMPLSLVVLGHVDHGKSTLVGRLLHETGSLPEGRLQAAEASCQRRGVAFEWAFLLDALQREREQNVTMDSTRMVLRLPGRELVLIDAPGHAQFLTQAATGAAAADAALLLVDATRGLEAQTHRHMEMLALLGISQLVVAITKMDALGYAQSTYEALHSALQPLLREYGLVAQSIVPLSAREGQGLLAPSAAMPWYAGLSLLPAIEALPPRAALASQPLRLPVQDVLRVGSRRVLVGRIESGQLAVGDRLCFTPGAQEATITSLEHWPPGQTPASHAQAGASVGITLAQPLFIQRGQVASAIGEAPVLATRFAARILWLGNAPLQPGTWLVLRVATQSVSVQVVAVPNGTLAHAQVGEVSLRPAQPVALEPDAKPSVLSQLVLEQQGALVAAGRVLPQAMEQLPRLPSPKSQHIGALHEGISPQARALRYGHRGGIVWFTGLSGSGKSTLAAGLQRLLFERGRLVYMLDGDLLRAGLNRDLGFSAAERRENIRRAGEVAALFADAGFIVLAAFISPLAEDRAVARAAAPSQFHLVYASAPLEACESRDDKGLYARARRGDIAQFTGISAPYEPPHDAELVLDTENKPIDQCLDELLAYVEKHVVAPVARAPQPS
jgi:bifunctional enzyme CysN/CysC